MKTVLVTGGAGFIGTNFIYYLNNIEPETFVINLDSLTYAGNSENLSNLPQKAQYQFINGNICDSVLVNDLFHQYKVDTVVHFAAESHVDRSILGPGQFIQTNIVGTFTLLEAARKAWIEEKIISNKITHFHHVSTDEVFGSLEQDEPAFSEKTTYSPNSPYSASKASSDHLVKAYFRTYGLPTTVTNCSNNYGPYQFPEKLIPLTIINALSGKQLPIYGDGLQIRDWLFVEDHCEAIWKVINQGQLGETYNIGGNNQPTNLFIVQTICSILDELAPRSDGRSYESQIQFVKDRPGHDRRYAMDIRKIHQELGWYPKETLQSGLFKTVRWYLDHSDWIKSVSSSSSYSNWIESNYSNRGELL